MQPAVELPPFEILLFIIAALIAVGNRVVDVARKARRKSAEEQRRRDQAEGVQLEESLRPAVRPTEQRRRDRAEGVQLEKSRQPAVKPVARELAPIVPHPPVAPRPPPLPYPSPQVPPQLQSAPRPRRHPPRLKLGHPEVPPPTRLRRTAKPPPVKWGHRRVTVRVHRAAARLLQDPQSLRDAIIVREVLGPPVAFRRFGR